MLNNLNYSHCQVHGSLLVPYSIKAVIKNKSEQEIDNSYFIR